MNIIRIAYLLTAVCSCVVFASTTCHAQKDPEAAARQAQIDADEARSKIQDLEEQQAGFADVQNQTTVEMAARDAQIGELRDELGEDERRRVVAEEAERQRP
jgi:septal ring factor EnvC (AmiA/AmiB activator)